MIELRGVIKILISLIAAIYLSSCGESEEERGCYYSVSLLNFGGKGYESLEELKVAFDCEHERYVFESQIHGEYLLVRAECKNTREYASNFEGVVVSTLSPELYNWLLDR